MSSPAEGEPRLLSLAVGGNRPTNDELRRATAEDLRPDPVIAEDSLGGVSIDERALADVLGLRGNVLRALPISLALALLAWRRRDDFDVVLSWGERPAFALALLLALTPRRRMAHLAILMRPCFTGGSSGPKRWIRRAVLPLLARHGMDRLLVPAPRQRQLVTECWRVAPGRFVPAGWSVDTRFWRPLDGPQDMICSVGREMRDYGTLIAALWSLNIPCHIATGSIHQDSGAADDPDASNIDGQTLPASVTVGHKSPVELRELYRRSRMVVVPIMPSDSDNGVSTIQEAMAMGRAVISTATAGRAEILEDGVNCVLVPELDPDALRAGIERLWNDPELCSRLGANGRQRVRTGYDVEVWIATIRAAAVEAAAGRRGRAPSLS
jgi:hypothetical protein